MDYGVIGDPTKWEWFERDPSTQINSTTRRHFLVAIPKQDRHGVRRGITIPLDSYTWDDMTKDGQGRNTLSTLVWGRRAFASSSSINIAWQWVEDGKWKHHPDPPFHLWGDGEVTMTWERVGE